MNGSFNYPIAREARTNQIQLRSAVGLYGIPNVLSQELPKPVKSTLDISHPLEHIEKKRSDRNLQLNLNIMRNVQGIHAPLRIMMELKCFDNVGRLPFLQSSNLSKDVLVGRDDYIDFEDILNRPEVHENLISPHNAMERKLGLH